MSDAESNPTKTTEAWLLRRGLPQFIDQYDSATHVWTRAQPLLIFVLVLELLFMVVLALLPGGTRAPLIALVGGIGALLAFGFWSKFKRGYWFAPADRVRWPFLLFFVLAPPISAAFASRSTSIDFTPRDAVVSFLQQIGILLVVYVITRYALVAMLVWGARETLLHARDIVAVATKALPLLLIVMIVLFINTEMWQVAGPLPAPELWLAVGSLLLLGVVVTFQRTMTQVETLNLEQPVELVRESCAGTPMEQASHIVSIEPCPPLSRSQRANLVVATMATQVIQAAIIGLVVWAFFIGFGLLAIPQEVQDTWLGDLLPNNDVYLSIMGDHVVTRATFRVSTFIGAFAAFYTTIYAASDETYREAFSHKADSELQRAIDVNRVYRAALGRSMEPEADPAK